MNLQLSSQFHQPTCWLVWGGEAVYRRQRTSKSWRISSTCGQIRDMEWKRTSVRIGITCNFMNLKLYSQYGQILIKWETTSGLTQLASWWTWNGDWSTLFSIRSKRRDWVNHNEWNGTSWRNLKLNTQNANVLLRMSILRDWVTTVLKLMNMNLSFFEGGKEDKH